MSKGNETKQITTPTKVCPRCGRTHHTFNNAPSYGNKYATCGQEYTQDGWVVFSNSEPTARAALAIGKEGDK